MQPTGADICLMATWVLSIKHVFRTCTNGLQSANNGRCMVGHAVNVPELIEGKTYINNSGYPDSKLDFPGQIPTSPISSAFSGHYFSLAAPMCQLALPGQIPTSLSMKPHEMGILHGLYMLQSQHMCYVNIPQISPNSYLMCPNCSL